MATTLEDLKAILADGQIQTYDNGKGSVAIMFPHEGQLLGLFVDIFDDGTALRWRIPFFMGLPPGRRRVKVMQKLLELNYRLKFLTFCLDPSDGEISVEVSYPIMDAPLTSEQARHTYETMRFVVYEIRSRLKRLIATGFYPPDEQELVDDSVRRLFEATEASSGEDSPEGGDQGAAQSDDQQCGGR